MPKRVTGAKVPAAIEDYLETQYPGILGDCVSYQVERAESGEAFVNLRLVFNDKSAGEAE